MAVAVESIRTTLSSRAVQGWLVLTSVALVNVWLLFMPPIIGLADQGDFVRILGPLGYAPVPKGPEHKYEYLTTTFLADRSYREPRWEQLTSELLLAEIAVRINGLLFDSKAFDLRLFGAVHLAFFLSAFGRLLFVTREFRLYWLIWLLSAVVLTDIGYAAYWNSLYTEPSSGIWFLFLVGESIVLCTAKPVTRMAVLRWTLFAVLCIGAKAQNAPLALPLACLCFAILRHPETRAVKVAASFSGIVVLSAGTLMYTAILPATRVTALYNTVFFGILPFSDSPEDDLRSLRLRPEYAQYSGTLAWSEGTGVADGSLVDQLQKNVTSATIMTLFLSHPTRIWAHVRRQFPTALSLRPEFCGNYERSAGRSPGAKSSALAVWSAFHEWCLPRIIGFLPIIALAMILRPPPRRPPNRWQLAGRSASQRA